MCVRDFLFLLLICMVCGRSVAQSKTKIYLNGNVTPVYFNDGDTFKILGGALNGSSARIAGFNTLESYGPVHQWGEWNPKELYFNAKMATLNARRGVWHCSTDMAKDTYGRILAECSDLAKDQVSKGFAHAMSISDSPADADLLKIQEEAIKNRRGFWAHGVPEFILTSPHSFDEAGSREESYDRLVSTLDGHSLKSKHDSRYVQCQKVCYPSESEAKRTNEISCMTYVDYRFRYGLQRADCLK